MNVMEHYKFELKPLPYAYDSLVPFIDELTMKLHHDRHLKTYVDNLNKALKNYPKYQDYSLERLIKQSWLMPKKIKTAVVNNAGGVYNHEFFFSILSDKRNYKPCGEIYKAIVSNFGTYDNFKNLFTDAALGVFGSGYAWLAMDPKKKLHIIKTANQETPLTHNMTPLITIDVWEHAYYLKNYNKRANYIDNFFAVLDYIKVNNIYLQNIKKLKNSN